MIWVISRARILNGKSIGLFSISYRVFLHFYFAFVLFGVKNYIKPQKLKPPSDR